MDSTMSRQLPNQAFLDTAFLDGGNARYLEAMYAQYVQNPSAFDPSWGEFFAQMGEDTAQVAQNAAGPSWKKPNWPKAADGDLISALDGNWAAVEQKLTDKIKGKAEKAGAPLTPEQLSHATRDSIHAVHLIRCYRINGHLLANLDPLEMEKRDIPPELDPAYFGFTEADYDRSIFLDGMLGYQTATLREILATLRQTYCGTVGYEYMHISDLTQRVWLQERIEGADKSIKFTAEGKRAILQRLMEADGFEKFLDVRYTGTKRFGLDGGESLIPALEQIIKRGGALGVNEVVLGMAHRGRLNVLCQVMKKPFRALFHEFKGGSSQPDDVEGSGDVKYHLGASADREFDGNTVHLSLTANPSHLEIVNPVVLGKVRAKQDQRGDRERNTVLPLLLHGDAAFAGQGVVAECFGLSGLKGHKTGGSVHFIINNQIGFTTNPRFSRSSPYPSDVAKMIDAPIFHCNGDDPEAVTFAAKLAIEFRQAFHKPVVVDMICYRRYGHNETDEPAFTQPIMYRKIRAHPTTMEIYSQRLIAEGVISAAEVDALKAKFRADLEVEYTAGQNFKPNKADWLDGRWSGLKSADHENDKTVRAGATGVDVAILKDIGDKITVVPSDFQPHKTIQRFLDNRKKIMNEGKGLDWATAEALALCSLLKEGHNVRLSGQDCERGTFSQRHTVLYDQETEKRYKPFSNLGTGQARYEVINSMLSEEAVLGYEYGYSTAEPKSLTIWEAQFGDFTNGAQVIIDQFISSAERKWLRMSGLVMMLPHGYEGQGPEHSSARVERFLQQCAEDNMQIVNCTTPANYFHVLRRQLKRDFRKPLVIFTPKSLLRHKRCVSDLVDMGPDSKFHRILRDDADYRTGTLPQKMNADDKIRRVVLCTGKVYYDLLDEREKRGLTDVYILRVEQLYPLPADAIATELQRFKNATVTWCQEEPKNMGAWSYIAPQLEIIVSDLGAKNTKIAYAGRAYSASTATGLMSKHLLQLAELLEAALG